MPLNDFNRAGSITSSGYRIPIGHEFESRFQILDGFSHLFVCKLKLLFEKTEEILRGRRWSIIRSTITKAITIPRQFLEHLILRNILYILNNS